MSKLWMSPKRLAKKALLGVIFGDGFLGVNNQNRVASPDDLKTARMCIGHGEDQLDYLLWKMQLLFPLVGDYNIRFSNDGREKWFLWAETRVSTYLRHIHKDCYRWNGTRFQRIVRMNVLRRMTPLSLALWFMDDGGFESPTTYVLRLCTQRYGKDGSQMIVDYFRECGMEWIVKSGLDNGHDSYWICTSNRVESEKFISIIQPFIHPDLLYKIDHSFHSMKHVGFEKDKQSRHDDIVRTLQQCGEVVRNYNPSQPCRLKLIDWKNFGTGEIGFHARKVRAM